jgi:hypothetical protein
VGGNEVCGMCKSMESGEYGPCVQIRGDMQL